MLIVLVVDEKELPRSLFKIDSHFYILLGSDPEALDFGPGEKSTSKNGNVNQICKIWYGNCYDSINRRNAVEQPLAIQMDILDLDLLFIPGSRIRVKFVQEGEEVNCFTSEENLLHFSIDKN